jgi:hypothetical protein
MPATVVTPSLQAAQPLVAPPGLPSVLSVTAHSTGDGGFVTTPNDLLYLYQQQVNNLCSSLCFPLIKIFIIFSLTVHIEAHKMLYINSR